MHENIDLTDKKELEWVLPFEIKKESTEYLYSNFLQKNNVPYKVCKSARNIEFTPLYVPAYIFDVTANVRYTVRYGKSTKQEKTGSGNDFTIWSMTSGHSVEQVKKQVVLATDLYDNDWFDNIGYYKLQNKLDFTKENSSGCKNCDSKRTLAQCWDIGEKFVSNKIEKILEKKVELQFNATSAVMHSQEVDYVSLDAQYLLLPVLDGSFEYNGENYKVLINGQTGNVISKLPFNFSKLMVGIVTMTVVTLTGLWAMHNNGFF